MASFHSNERIAPSNRGIKHLESIGWPAMSACAHFRQNADFAIMRQLLAATVANEALTL
jgi:ribonuclease I